jgi:hypothetical protein
VRRSRRAIGQEGRQLARRKRRRERRERETDQPDSGDVSQHRNLQPVRKISANERCISPWEFRAQVYDALTFMSPTAIYLTLMYNVSGQLRSRPFSEAVLFHTH